MAKSKDKNIKKIYPKRTHKQISKGKNEEDLGIGKKNWPPKVIKI